ncbi:MAG: hypothetical protein ACK4YQ_14685 [Phenylobacterium sp.]|uniref:hypothetical protein n=1 Tax=Phenylobacterium sp. TaxID=1871053 RepID=UPI00391C896A
MPSPALVLAAAVALSPAVARAGEAPCWFEHGVVVAPAVVVGVAGDFIVDTGSPATLLHDTRAQGAGISGEAVRGDVRLAGLTARDRPVQVISLDSRTYAFDTPIAGVIGADVLSGHVLDVSFAPCRLSLRAPGRAGRFRALAELPFLGPGGGPPVVRAAVSDGPSARSGGFVAATGAAAPVRLSDRAAAAAGTGAEPAALYPEGSARAQLRALSFAGALDQFLGAGLVRAGDLPPGAIGVIGGPVLGRHRLRFDFPRGRLLVGAP